MCGSRVAGGVNAKETFYAFGCSRAVKSSKKCNMFYSLRVQTQSNELSVNARTGASSRPGQDELCAGCEPEPFCRLRLLDIKLVEGIIKRLLLSNMTSSDNRASKSQKDPRRILFPLSQMQVVTNLTLKFCVLMTNH